MGMLAALAVNLAVSLAERVEHRARGTTHQNWDENAAAFSSLLSQPDFWYNRDTGLTRWQTGPAMISLELTVPRLLTLGLFKEPAQVRYEPLLR